MYDKEIKCRICGKTDSLSEWVECNEKKIMEKENVCFNCAFWFNKIATTNENTVVVNGTRYTIGDENSKSYFKGFGGAKFVIEFFDGRKVVTHNLWRQGDIPEEFRSYPELQDNARFINEV